MSLDPSCSAAERSSCAIPDRIPVFPLPNIVFFPRTYLPLHIFEPRYRQMVMDAPSMGHCIGMALLKDGWQEQYYGNPPVYDLGCVGRIVQIQSLPDGRFNIVLQGLRRYKILGEELARASYRTAHIEPAEETVSESLSAEVRADLLAILHQSLVHRDEDPTWGNLFDVGPTDEVLVNTLSASLDFTPVEKQLLLEADTVRQRARRLSDLLQFKRYERNDWKGRG